MTFEDQWFMLESEKTLHRLLPRIEARFGSTENQELFIQRLQEHFPTLFRHLIQLYGMRYDFLYYLDQLIDTMIEMFENRPADLKMLDQIRLSQPDWYLSEKMVGAVCYVNLFAKNIKGIEAQIPYFQELGITYLHLMPLFKAPETNNDGGYAISDYRNTDPQLGSMDDLRHLAAALRKVGISLTLDFVFNHTSNEHEWALKALKGDPKYKDYYYFYPNREVPDQYELNLREIFPEQAPGNFTYLPKANQWVWTTFYTFQWDLNYRNPDVFIAMLGELLYLANQGVEILRLDAVAFIWKEMGTGCENLDQAHWIIQAYNAIVKIVAPALIFKSEAIVHPRDVLSYMGTDQCQISYNPTLMALLWDTCATRDVSLLRHSMSKRFPIPESCAWVNYIRVHDDIGWTFADEDAWELGINAYEHRQFLNQFYIGDFEGSFATGLPFNYNPVNRDMRICGSAASLIGLEQALALDNPLYIENALKRLKLINNIIMSIGGIPLIYIGDEIASLNDYSYQTDPQKLADSRWVHRSYFQWERAAERHQPDTIPGQIFSYLTHIIHIRKTNPVFAGHKTLFIHLNKHVFSFIRNHQLLVLANFSEISQEISIEDLRVYWNPLEPITDLLTDQRFDLNREKLSLDPYQVLWLNPEN